MAEDKKIDEKFESDKSPEKMASSGVGAERLSVQPEKHESRENLRDAVLHEIDTSEDEDQSAAVPKTAAKPISAYAEADQIKQIENILEENLDGLYLSLNAEDRSRFKRAGEAAAEKINGLISENTKKVFRKIIELIKEWLTIIPGIKNFYIEQEAKIKADKIMNEFGLDKYR